METKYKFRRGQRERKNVGNKTWVYLHLRRKKIN